MLAILDKIGGAVEALERPDCPSASDAERSRDDMPIHQSTKPSIPAGFCQCGCGARTNLAPHNDAGRGWVKDAPLRYVSGHTSRTDHTWYVLRSVGGGASIYEHLSVAETALGKPLPRRAQVHHVDEDRRNNSPSNLVICQDLAYHKLLHFRARIVRAGGDPRKHLLCSTCREVKPFAAFNARRGAGSGYQTACRSCQSVYQQSYVRPNRNGN